MEGLGAGGGGGGGGRWLHPAHGGLRDPAQPSDTLARVANIPLHLPGAWSRLVG